MYVPEINFLRDRTDAVDLPAVEQRYEPEPGGFDPLIIAVIVPVVALAIVAVTTLFLNGQIDEKNRQLADTNAQIAAIQGEVTRLQGQQKELAEIQGRSQAVVNLFDLSKPWSAVLEDLRRRVPANVWLEKFSTAQDAVTISGRALDYSQVAAFQLTLSDSPFVQAVTIQDTSKQAGTATAPTTITYTLNVTLKPLGIGQFASALEQTGSVGLLEKLRRLQKENLVQ
jgi:type IV pilus assembly protein PilN